MSQRVRSVVVGYYIGITLLVIGLAVAVALLTRAVQPSEGGIEIGSPIALACEPGDGSPSCFGFSVRNTSSETLSVQCVVLPAELTAAGFADGGPMLDLVLGPNEERILRTSVDIDGGDVVTAPQLQCAPVGP